MVFIGNNRVHTCLHVLVCIYSNTATPIIQGEVMASPPPSTPPSTTIINVYSPTIIVSSNEEVVDALTAAYRRLSL